ncbi:MAG TPA: tail fiber protein [Thermoanaerobaculia bacterium]|jgi:microcystin-dependent protein|nr:tail fiber protein [Thermoanaerobaculia bacterium]
MDAFIGEIRRFPNQSLPEGWELCDGRLLRLAQYQELYSLIGNMYGGDGRTTPALPDLRDRTPVHQPGYFATKDDAPGPAQACGALVFAIAVRGQYPRRP